MNETPVSTKRLRALRIMLIGMVLWTFCMDEPQSVTHATAPGAPLVTTVCDSISDSRGILIDNASPFVTYTTVRYHSASGIYLNYSGSTISHNVVYSNTASSGAGLNIEHGSVKLDSNTITWNKSATRGGGIRGFGSGSVTITNNTISDNSADNYGGGGILLDSISGLVYHNTISRNSENSPPNAGCGGGIASGGIA